MTVQMIPAPRWADEDPKVRLNSLTGLRWFAALSVFIAHAGFLGPDFLWLGKVGVAFFFCLSGFVLAWSAPAADTANSFYRRRFARVYPLHVTTLIGAFTVAILGWSRIPMPTVGQASAVLLLMQGWLAATPAGMAINGPSWTLSHEAFFYALFPHLRGDALSARGWLIVAGAALGWPFAFAIVLTNANHAITGHLGFNNPVVSDLFASPLGTVGMFVAGIALARAMTLGWRPGAPRAWIGVALLYTAVMPFCLDALPFPRGWYPSAFFMYAAIAPALAGLIVAIVTLELTHGSSWLGSRRLVALGAWSFAFYLVHYTVLLALDATVERGARDVRLWLIRALALGVSIGLAAFLHRFVEAPLERQLRATRKAATGSRSSSRASEKVAP